MNRYNDIIRIAVLPLDIVWADKKANFEAVERAFSQLPQGTDIVVLPELFSTGFADDEALMRDMAERNTQETIDFVRSLAEAHSVAIAGTFLASTPPHIYNRAFFIEPNGDETFYDKRHLFSLSTEARILTPGTERVPVVRFRGWNIAMIVCYDLRFPVWCRCRKHSYDMLLVPANWPQARGYAFTHLCIARAIENQCVVVAADRGGHDAYGDYDGLAQIFDGRGMPVGTQAEGSPFIIADISRSKQDDYRRNFPVVNDADDFEFLSK